MRASALGFLAHAPCPALDPAPGSALLTLPITTSAQHSGVCRAQRLWAVWGTGAGGGAGVTPGRKEEAPAEKGTEVLKGNGK